MSEESNFKVPLTKIIKVEKHSNADKLSIYTVYGFQVIGGLNQYKVGDLVIYVPIDSILPQELEDQLFGKDSKVKLNKHRVRQIKLRGLASQGLLIDSKLLGDKICYLQVEQDLSGGLNITKYEPPQKNRGTKPSTPRNRPLENPRLHKYGGVTNLKWMPNFFDGKEVIAQTKLHGSNCRASYSKTATTTLWKKILKFLRILPAYEFCYGSNNVQLQDRDVYKGFYGEDIYAAALKRVDAFNKLKPGECIFGEVIGEGIQANYHYGHKEHHFVLFDVKVERPDGSQEYLDPEEAEAYAKERGFDFVPVVYRGIYDAEKLKLLSEGPDDYYPQHKVKEGLVIKLRKGYGEFSNKHALKLINEAYLADQTNSDDH